MNGRQEAKQDSNYLLQAGVESVIHRFVSAMLFGGLTIGISIGGIFISESLWPSLSSWTFGLIALMAIAVGVGFGRWASFTFDKRLRFTAKLPSAPYWIEYVCYLLVLCLLVSILFVFPGHQSQWFWLWFNMAAIAAYLLEPLVTMGAIAFLRLVNNRNSINQS